MNIMVALEEKSGEHQSHQVNKPSATTFCYSRILTGGPSPPVSPLTPRAPVIPYVQDKQRGNGWLSAYSCTVRYVVQNVIWNQFYLRAS